MAVVGKHMTDALIPESGQGRGMAKAILTGGLAAGLFDIIYAMMNSALRGVPPDKVLQAVASGVFGRDAYAGGYAMVALGVVFHFAMTIVMAALFVIAWRRMAVIRTHAIMMGLAYGVAIYFAMKWIVLPLSNFPPGGKGPINPLGLLAHIFLVGLPIAVAARRWGPEGRTVRTH